MIRIWNFNSDRWELDKGVKSISIHNEFKEKLFSGIIRKASGDPLNL